MTIWKVNCMEHLFPGMWQRWFKNQCVAVGWNGSWGYHLRGRTERDRGWENTRGRLDRVAVGDKIVVQLRNHRFGRVGEVTGKAIEDSDWDPLVPRTADYPDGEMGRRIFVRWDLTSGPDDKDWVVQVPEGKRLPLHELRPAICKISSCEWEDVLEIMADQDNWVGLTNDAIRL